MLFLVSLSVSQSVGHPKKFRVALGRRVAPRAMRALERAYV